MVLGHRGTGTGPPPNSVEAVRSAAADSAGGVEIDVNVTADDRLVAWHDSSLGLEDAWVTELSSTEFFDRTGTASTDHGLLSVMDAALNSGLLVYLDIKTISGTGIERIGATWPNAVTDGRVVFASARGDVLSGVRDRLPTAATSLLYYDWLLDVTNVPQFLPVTFVHPCFDFLPDPFAHLTGAYVERVRDAGLGLVSWNVTDERDIGHLADLRVDMICTDDPGRAARHLAAQPT